MALFSSDERSCQNCYGSGKSNYWYSTKDAQFVDECDECYGTGQGMTEIGRELVGFLKKHYELVPKKR